ncbi:hypothetical protein ACWDSJ_27815 [Nocardia sp. NPDC003482]
MVEPWLTVISGGPDRSVAAVIAEAESMLPRLWREVGELVGEDQLGPDHRVDVLLRPLRPGHEDLGVVPGRTSPARPRLGWEL